MTERSWSPSISRAKGLSLWLAGGAAVVAVGVALAWGPPGGRTAKEIAPVAAPRSAVIRPAPAPWAPAASFGEPLPGYAVISPFGLRQLPWEAHPRLHNGVDIVAPLGSAVHAVAGGVVARTGADSGYGRFVEIAHPGGITSLYAHLGAIAAGVQAGVAVLSGAPLGEVGSTGSSTGAHLHFSMRDAGGRPLDPAYFIGRTYQTASQWPLADARRISSAVRIAYVSNIPLSKREMMIALQEAKGDEQATQEMVMMGAAPPPPVLTEVTLAQTAEPAPHLETPVLAQSEAIAAAPVAPPQLDAPMLDLPPLRPPRPPPRLAIPD